jgi:plasmid stabilization system protein ParE
MARVGWTVEARADLREIKRWIARDSPRYASAMEARIRAAVRQLGRFPESGRTIPESPNGPYRELIVGSYRVIYLHNREQNQVAILTIVHGSRRLSPLPDES